MVWLQSFLLFVHIVGATFWFGSGLFLEFLVVPALVGMKYEAQHPFLLALSGRYAKLIGPVGGLTVLFGILRGISTGVLGYLGSPYGVTWLASIAGAVVVITIGARFIGPTADKMAAATTREEVVSLAGKITRYGRFDATGMLVMIALMVAMRAGY